jgi:hypothetical protein
MENVLYDLELEDTAQSIVDEIEERILEPTPAEIEAAISIIQHHIEKESRNRQVPVLAPEDLCPMQKRNLVKDLSRLLRG